MRQPTWFPSWQMLRVHLALATIAIASRAAEPPSAPPPFLPEPIFAVLAGEISGSVAKRTVQELTLHHRQRGSEGFHAASEAIRSRLVSYGLERVEVIELPADGRVFYGTQRSRPAWDAERASLWEMRREGDAWRRGVQIASWERLPVSLAQDSAGGRGSGVLVDVGAGTSGADYEGKEIAGNFVLTSSQPQAVRALAVDRFGAGGVVSFAQNQPSAWWKEDESLVRWGHAGAFPEPGYLAFMVSLKQAREWQRRLAAGETIRLEGEAEAGQRPGHYRIVTAAIPGREPDSQGEIAFSCHLDHQQPGANDNASGCAAILEVARSLQRLISGGALPRPRRTLRWYWPPEIEGTLALLNARPEIPRRTLTVIHMDMVGGDPALTKAIFHVTRGPASVPSFVNDVAAAFGRYVNAQSDAYASAEGARHPLVDPQGGKEALLADMADFSMGSDHQVWAEGSWRVPAIYLNDWPDRYIHTHKDGVANIDATKLLRAALIGAASAYTLADLDTGVVPELWAQLKRHSLERSGAALARAAEAGEGGRRDGDLVLHYRLEELRATALSIASFVPLGDELEGEIGSFFEQLGAVLDVPAVVAPLPGQGAAAVYRRAPEPKGGMSAFGYSYLSDQLQERGLTRPALLTYEGLWGGGSEYAYEALNLVDGVRSVSEIRDRLTATYGPVHLDLVREYLETLEKIEILEAE